MLNPGTKLGPYEIQSLVGAGGMGEVYRARDSRLKRDVAIKVLPKTLSADADRLRRFEQEALATAALNHPNILAVFDIGENDSSPFVVSELLEGETLRDRLRTGTIPVRKALDYALQAAQGLAAAHGKGIIHRDLKPENLFLTKDGRLKILDFGLAKLTQSEPAGPASLTISHGTEAGVVLGTVGYMSPEQVRGQPLDPRSDIFSFGAIFYEMLSGKRAFHGDTAADTMSAILKEEPGELSATNRNVSPALERIVHHCLEKNPEARFHSARDIAFDLEHLSGISGTSAKVAPVEAVQPKRKPPMPAITGALTLALLMLAAGWWLGHSTSASPPEYKQVTFRKGLIGNARFAPDGGIIYSATWDGDEQQIYMTRADSPSAHELGIKDAELLAVSRNGELAVRLRSVSTVNGLSQAGTLARVPLGGGTPREVLDNVMDADWASDGESMAVARYIPENGHWHLEYPIGKVLLDSINWISTTKISPDGKWIAFADHENNAGDDEGSIAVIASDGKGGERKLSTGWEAIEGIVWSGNDEIWFTSAMSGFSTNAHAVNLSGKVRDITNVPGGMWLQDLHNGKALVVTERGGRGVRAVAEGAKAERELGWFGWSLPAAISRDGSKVLFYDVGEAGGRDYTVFLRDLDGSPPAMLGQGSALALSPDNKWIITEPARGGSLNLVPTGAGEAKALTHDSINYNGARFLPDGKQLLASGIEPGHGERDYLINLSTGDSKPVTPDGVSGVTLSPNGKEAAVRGPDGKWEVWPLEGGAMHPIPQLESKDHVIGWSADGSSVFATSTQRFGGPAKVYKVNVTTGKMDLWKTLGAASEFAIVPLISADEKAYAYGYGYQTSEAYIVSGLK